MINRIKELKNNSSFMRYFTNTSWVMGEKLLQIVSSIIIGVWVARYLGPENLGILSYAQSYVAIFLSFSTLGLNGILVRELVLNPQDKNNLVGTSFILQSLGSILLMSVLVIGIQFTKNTDLLNKIIIILGTVTFFQSFGVIKSYFESIVESKYIVYVSVIGMVISSVLKVYLILTEAPLIYFVYVILSDSIVIALGQIYFYKKKKLSLKSWTFSAQKAKKLLKDSWPLILSGIIVSVYMKVDQIMIKEIMDTASVGQYSAAVRLSEAWYFIPIVISSSLFPAVVNAKKISEELYYKRLQKLYDLMVIISLSIAIPFTFLSEFLVQFLYGDAYYLSGGVLSIHIWTGIFVFLGVSRGNWILNENLQRYTSLYLGIGMLINLILNWFFIPKFGIIGAAYATLISQSVSVLFAPYLFKATRISFYMMIKSLTFYNIIINSKKS
ncbi:flippase [Cellulophaga baltica]|uniref:flippase n=1 Tax=Cellulophaga baltica TaxID=76594 RepID=UPI0021483531|nr:flippase [Cellulophaga baltica]MCR1025127.1 flippase [Cellulophaga baltica]